MNNLIQPSTFTVPLTLKARQQAQFLGSLQANPHKANQVYRNTLAVWAVNTYLEALGFSTSLTASDSQDSVMASLSDCADLIMDDLGKLECRPVLPNSTVISMPSPSSQNRIGCIAVELDADLRQATLLGFIKSWTTETISLSALRPLLSLLEYLDDLKQRIDLRLWFQNVTTSSWKTVEQILDEVSSGLGQSVPMLAYRSATTILPDTIPALIDLFNSHPDKWTRVQVLGLLGSIAAGDESTIAFLTEVIHSTEDEELRRQAAVSLGIIQPNHGQAGVRRARVLELGMQLSQQRLLLVLTLTPAHADDTEIHVRLYPTSHQSLPAHLHLRILDESGTLLLEEQTLGDEDWLQLGFQGTQGDRFSIQLELGEALFSEAFMI